MPWKTTLGDGSIPGLQQRVGCRCSSSIRQIKTRSVSTSVRGEGFAASAEVDLLCALSPFHRGSFFRIVGSAGLLGRRSDPRCFFPSSCPTSHAQGKGSSPKLDRQLPRGVEGAASTQSTCGLDFRGVLDRQVYERVPACFLAFVNPG